MAIRELYLGQSLNKADYSNASSFIYYDSYLLEILNTAHGRVARPSETDWEFCRPPLAEPPSSGLHFLRTRTGSHPRDSGRPGSRLIHFSHVF